jgi:hypothetical protein
MVSKEALLSSEQLKRKIRPVFYTEMRGLPRIKEVQWFLCTQMAGSSLNFFIKLTRCWTQLPIVPTIKKKTLSGSNQT